MSIDPRAHAMQLEREPELPTGASERFQGYGVMAAPFRSGHILAMRRFPASSLGHGYTSVWHRDPGGAWTFWSDRAPLESCPRYFGRAIARTITTPVELRWPDEHRLDVSIPSAELRWSIELAATPATRVLNRVARAMPDRLWRSPAVLSMMSRTAGGMLHAGRLQLAGKAPNGQTFVANPTELWIVRASSASIAGRDLGQPGPVPEQARLGDFWIPQRGLFAFGRAFFEPAVQHVVVPQGPRADARPS